MTGFDIWRQVKAKGKGRIQADLEQGTIKLVGSPSYELESSELFWLLNLRPVRKCVCLEAAVTTIDARFCSSTCELNQYLLSEYLFDRVGRIASLPPTRPMLFPQSQLL